MGQYHNAVECGSELVSRSSISKQATRYRVVVLTPSHWDPVH